MKKIILSVFTLGLVLVSCNKEEVVTVSETETIEQNLVNTEEDEYAFSKELTVLDESGNVETKFLVSAESEEFYNAFMESNQLVVKYIDNFTPDKIIAKNESKQGGCEGSFISENETNHEIIEGRLAKPKIEFELLDNELSKATGTSIQLSFTQSATQNKCSYTYGGWPVAFSSTSYNHATVVNTGPWCFIAYYEFKIKWYSPYRTHHSKYHSANTSSEEFFGNNYHTHKCTIYPDYFSGQTSYYSVNFHN